MNAFTENDAGIFTPVHKLLMGGSFHAELIRDAKVIDEWDFGNIVVNEGLNSALNVLFNGATPIGSWYIGLFQGNYTPVATDAAATISANSTECSAYAAGVRQIGAGDKAEGFAQEQGFVDDREPETSKPGLKAGEREDPPAAVGDVSKKDIATR